jgi:peroxiredoxin|tara:strand:+ start:7144 stop:7776 length:633 start_codon:yes stop_codon:yes gene_type:complete
MFEKMKRVLGVSAAVAVGGTMIAAGVTADKKAEVGKPAPDFTLTDYQGKEHTLSSYTAQGNIVVLEWFNHECPFVKKHYNHESDTMNAMVKAWEGKPVVWLRVNSATPTNPVGKAENVAKAVKEWDITTPILVDADGKVGKMYGAKRTPEMYVITPEGVLAYHGAIDNDRTARGPGDLNYVEQAVGEIVAGKPVSVPTTDAYGCSVKYAN